MVFRWQEKPRGWGHSRPASFLVLMIDRDESSCAAQIDLSRELCLTPQANCSCQKMSWERSERRSPYIVTTRCCSNCQVFTPYCQFYYCYFIYLAVPEVGTYILTLTLASPGHIPLSLSSLLLTFSHIDRGKRCKTSESVLPTAHCSFPFSFQD